MLLENEGISKRLKDVFIFYLISSSRPFHEMLFPRKQQIKKLYDDKFLGMNLDRISLEDLDTAFNQLVFFLKKTFEEKDIEFLKSLLLLKPKWELSPIKNMKDYPSIKWRLFNIEKMDSFKKQKEIMQLDKYLIIN